MIAPGPLPEPFGAYFSDLEEQQPPGDYARLFPNCFGCGPHHPDGLRVRCFKTSEGIAAPILIPDRFQGPPGTAHGGIVAAYLDEVLAATVVRATGRIAVTGELTVRYVAPVPTETAVLGHGGLVMNHGRYVDVEGRLEDFASRRLLAAARARFVFPAG